jgi:hypothetical protein
MSSGKDKSTMSISQTSPTNGTFLSQNMHFNHSDEIAHYSTPAISTSRISSATCSESETFVTSKIFSNTSCNDSDSSLSESATPMRRQMGTPEQLALSDSVTPVNDPAAEMAALDPDQLTLRLYLHSSLSGGRGLPDWTGLAKALRVYFRNSWQGDNYSLEYCEKHVKFLYSIAIADEKWRIHRQKVV